MGEPKGNWVIPWCGPSHHLKCEFKLKTKKKDLVGWGGGGSQISH